MYIYAYFDFITHKSYKIGKYTVHSIQCTACSVRSVQSTVFHFFQSFSDFSDFFRFFSFQSFIFTSEPSPSSKALPSTAVFHKKTRPFSGASEPFPNFTGNYILLKNFQNFSKIH